MFPTRTSFGVHESITSPLPGAEEEVPVLSEPSSKSTNEDLTATFFDIQTLTIGMGRFCARVWSR